MDFEDATDTSDSQVVLALEFNNQATLNQNENISAKRSLQFSGLENHWHDDDDDIEPPQASALTLPIALPPPPGSPLAPLYSEAEPDSTFADDFEALFSSADNQPDHLGDLIDLGAEAGVCGLRNLGNTCFMSTGVQCLMATPALVHCLLQPTPAPTLTLPPLTAHLSQLTHKMWSGQYSAVQPSDFKETLGAHYPQFKDFRQHDCQEFLALLLDGLHEQMNHSFLHNKLQDILETDCDVEKTFKASPKQVPNGLCKNISPSHNNLKESNDTLQLAKMAVVNEVVEKDCKVDTKINNCVVQDNATADTSYKLPIIINKCDNEASCDPIVKNEPISPILNKAKETTLSNVLNNCSPRLSGFEDIIKDAKTSNVNVLVTEQEANNEIKFDSDKFPKSEKVRRRESFSHNSFHLYENNMTSGKRGKSTVTHYSSTVDFREGLDMKRLKMQPEGSEDCDRDWDKNHRMEDERIHRVNSKNLDKNYRMECERRGWQRDGPGPSSASTAAEAAIAELDPEAEVHWQKHLAAHQSVIVDTFQGQFKSTVVCSTCKHVSVTYEPFMYLSVPLPHAMERQLSVTFVSAKDPEPVQYLLTVNKRDTVANIREQLLNLIGRPISFTVLAEVLDHHIAKILDENHLVRYINSTTRNLYAFEYVNFSRFAGEETTADDDKMEGCDANEDLTGDACTICLEEKESNMSRHVGCTCVLCDSCILRSSQHYGGETLKCPVCRKELIPGDNLVSVGLTPDTKPTVRMLNVSLVFRLDTEGGGNNNRRTVQLFGHPHLLRLPNRLQCQQLQEAVATLVPYRAPYKILLVDGQGHHCSRCMFNAHCRGCPIADEGSLVLTTGDSLAAMFTEPVSEIASVQHSTMLRSVPSNTLSLYDCIQAFSQSEILDEHNPWYCPSCKKNQCATKTLSVWRYPNYLIIYLKRFVFQDCVSTKLDDKVTFPLCGLNLSPNGSLYDLYACVCHVGGVSAGHYTAYTQHPRTGEWHHYNDDCVTKQPPQEDDYSNAYILFYKKRGADLKNEDFNAKLVTLNGENH